MPELMCTTVPPAKSRAPHEKMSPASAVTASSFACAAALASPLASATALAASARASGPAQYQTMWAIGK